MDIKITTNLGLKYIKLKGIRNG